MLKTLLVKVESRPELVVLMLMVIVIAMLIVPLPATVLDVLIGFNITTALLVFMGSFYIVNILDFSTFPSILLITTLFRLSLSISTSRLILLEAEGGKIIATFGQFVIGDNLVVGFVVFAIVTIVQFIVITKGSERVAEVAARFSLDAMPGKQMSIDADLRAGLIDNAGVEKRRSELERQSQLYGAFDGAMKFVKGDAIAGIIVIFVNLIGGIAVGVAQHGMSMSDALTTYTILTIGDGLVAQIPALLIAIAAGFVVTRVGGSKANLGADIIGELLSNSFALLATAALAFGIGLLPGFPMPVFSGIAVVLGGLYVRRVWKSSRDSPPSHGRGLVGKLAASFGGASAPDQQGGAQPEHASADIDKLVPETVPLMVMVSEAVKPKLEAEQAVAAIRRQAFADMGLRLPEIAISASPGLADTEVVVLINEIRAATFHICFEKHRVVGSTLVLEGLPIEARTLPDGTGGDAFWVDPEQASLLTKMGVRMRTAFDDFYDQFMTLVLRNINEFFGVQEAKRLLDDMEKKYPELLKETYRHASVQRVSEVFQRLLGEKISVRNMKLILESLAQWAPKEKDAVLLVEHVRVALARYISNRFATGGRLNAFMLSHDIEETVGSGIRQTSTGTFLNLEPAKSEALLDLIAVELSRVGFSQRDIVLLTSMEIRRFVKRLIERRFPELEVLSFGEVADSATVDVLKTI
ncbi:EscV/YscV/HrcV family type III secretion system export apparatus protein [Pandoraea pulmonicola]|uniref:EscV/YscV/HrcV family type III secretion system export apparatus protein n=1 Tax=Pandoraea pulmonicola TaxID=93221 RepID=A0AAJ5D3A0_PANPU|nr:EscV/YscV/HrcV family type III secretion system export apparatus protein [Pandoraea pulmonicola]AJC22367.1 EscV/YscV/HrcV family type III secretion system export apparatus protein [Pandoraea pulmonicola]SUD95606.1 Invasion protein invA [Pandoraea pulmonicola]